MPSRLPFPVRIAHVSDLHVTDGPRLTDQREALGRIAEAIEVQRPHLIAVTGDLFGHTVPHRSTPRERQVLYPWIARLSGIAPVFIVYGNHDARPDLDVLELLGRPQEEPESGSTRHPIRVLDGAGWLELEVPEDPDDSGGRTLPVRIVWFAYPTTGWLLADREAVAVEHSRLEASRALAGFLAIQSQFVHAQPDRAHVVLGHVMVGGSLTSGGEVLAGQEIEVQPAHLQAVGAHYVALGHLHRAQEVAPGAWYAGSPWRTDFGDLDESKGWLAVEVGEDGRAQVDLVDSGARRFGTIDYRWQGGFLVMTGATPPSAFGTPTPLHEVDGMEVKLRLTAPAPEMAAARSAFADAVATARARGAYRVVVETVAEPVLRVRAPELAQATTLEERLQVVWRQMDPEPPPEDQAAALAQLGRLAADLGGAA